MYLKVSVSKWGDLNDLNKIHSSFSNHLSYGMSTKLIIFPSNFLEFSNNFDFSFDFQHRHANTMQV